jgi:hypothetical protein
VFVAHLWNPCRWRFSSQLCQPLPTFQKSMERANPMPTLSFRYPRQHSMICSVLYPSIMKPLGYAWFRTYWYRMDIKRSNVHILYR